MSKREQLLKVIGHYVKAEVNLVMEEDIKSWGSLQVSIDIRDAARQRLLDVIDEVLNA